MVSHRYLRQFDPRGDNSLALLAGRIPEGATVLELGPAGGYFTQHLRESRRCTIDAVELDPQMADAARPWCRTMLVGNLETLPLPELLPAAAYDVVLMADVLEHLRDPLPLLQQLHALLKPGGACLISVPNVAYGGLVASLLGGEFEYRAEGLLDQTHLRFYTQRSLAQLLTRAGWFPGGWQPVRLPYWESEFRTRLETLPRALVDVLVSRPELSCYQWVLEARAEPASLPETPGVYGFVPETWPVARFPVRLFWAAPGESFDYVRSQIAWGQIGASRKGEEFVLDVAANATGLRLRLADRPGFLRLYSVVIHAADEQILWQWTPADGVAALASACSGLHLADADEHALVLIGDAESWLDLAWQGTATAPACKVSLASGWPESADFAAAQSAWEQAVQPLRAELDAVKTLVGERDQALVNRDALLQAQVEHLQAQSQRLQAQDAHLQAQQENLQAQQRHQETLAGEIATLRQCLDAQMAQTTTLQIQISRMQTFSGWLKQPLRWLRKLT